MYGHEEDYFKDIRVAPLIISVIYSSACRFFSF